LPLAGYNTTVVVVADLTDADLCELGRMVVACALVEGGVRPVLSSLMGLRDHFADIVFAERSHSWILDTLAATVALRVEDPALCQEWMEWIREAKDVNSRRNAIIHAQWLTSGDDPSGLIASVRLTRRGRRKVQTLHFSDPSAFSAVADDANNLSARMFNLMFRTPGVLAGSEPEATPPAETATGEPPGVIRTDMVVLGRIEPADPTP
jgi:hypothetical protein